MGDSIGPGSTIGYTAGDARPEDHRLSRCLIIDVERSLRYDATYPLRLLVDIALRALSPGTNDPTTATRALDEIEAALAVAATRPLGTVETVAAQGHAIVRNRSWNDLVELALDEITRAGSDQPQITRRLLALLDDIDNCTPPARRPALQAIRANIALRASAAHPRDVAFLLTPDRQGIGGAQSTASPYIDNGIG